MNFYSLKETEISPSIGLEGRKMIYQMIPRGVEGIPEDEIVSRMIHPSRGPITGVFRSSGAVTIHRGVDQESDIIFGATGTVFDQIAKAADLRSYLHGERGPNLPWEMWRRPIDLTAQGV